MVPSASCHNVAKVPAKSKHSIRGEYQRRNDKDQHRTDNELPENYICRLCNHPGHYITECERFVPYPKSTKQGEIHSTRQVTISSKKSTLASDNHRRHHSKKTKGLPRGHRKSGQKHVIHGRNDLTLAHNSRNRNSSSSQFGSHNSDKKTKNPSNHIRGHQKSMKNGNKSYANSVTRRSMSREKLEQSLSPLLHQINTRKSTNSLIASVSRLKSGTSDST